MTPRFILAKYAPDLARMEPRNVGVIVWSKGELRAKFLSAADAAFVNEPDTYERWVKFWSDRIAGDAVAPSRGPPVSKTTPECLDALITTQKGNYLLVESGEILGSPRKKQLPAVVEQLFSELVAVRPPKSGEQAKSFQRRCDSLLASAGIEFKPRHPVECEWRGVERPVHPDYYIGNGHPDGILQRATVSNERSVNHAALLMEALITSQKIAVSHCRALVRSSDVQSHEAEQGMRLLESISGVIDVDASTALAEVSAVASANGDG